MKSVKVVFILALISGLIVFIFMKGGEEKVWVNELEQQTAPKSVPRSASEATPVPTPTPVATASLKPPKAEITKIMHELEEIKTELPSRDRECEKELDKLLPSNVFIDPNDPYWKNTGAIIEKLHDIYKKTMEREVSREGHQRLEKLAREESLDDPIKTYQMMKELDICRHERSLNFIETAFEAHKAQKWNDSVRQEVVYVVLTMMDQMLKEHYQVENLTYTLGTMRLMIQNNLIPNDFMGDINSLYQRTLDQERIFRRSFNPSNTKQQNLRALREDFAEKRIIGEMIRDLMKSALRNAAPDFD